MGWRNGHVRIGCSWLYYLGIHEIVRDERALYHGNSNRFVLRSHCYTRDRTRLMWPLFWSASARRGGTVNTSFVDSKEHLLGSVSLVLVTSNMVSIKTGFELNLSSSVLFILYSFAYT